MCLKIRYDKYYRKKLEVNGASSVLSIQFLLVLEGRCGQAVAAPFAWRPALRAAPISRKIQVSDADGTGRCNRADLILFLSFLKKRNKILLSRFDKTR